MNTYNPNSGDTVSKEALDMLYATRDQLKEAVRARDLAYARSDAAFEALQLVWWMAEAYAISGPELRDLEKARELLDGVE